MEGPRFLWRPEEEWPKFEENSTQDLEESKKELKPNKVKATKPNEPTILRQKDQWASDNHQTTLFWNT